MKIEEIFDLLLTELDKGKTIDEVLKEYPQFRQEFEPLLSLVKEIRAIPKPEPNPERVTQTLKSLDASRRTLYASGIKRLGSGVKRLVFPPVMVRVAVGLLLMILVGWTSVSYSQKSVPGHLLYPLKRFTERVQYKLSSRKNKVKFHIIFAQRRTDELKKLNERARLRGVLIRIDKRLLAAMLNEANLALRRSTDLPSRDSKSLLLVIKEITRYQHSALQEIKSRVASYDTAVINEAISLSLHRQECLHSHKTAECLIPCSCWNKWCEWK